jgi:hypothetical protein
MPHRFPVRRTLFQTAGATQDDLALLVGHGVGLMRRIRPDVRVPKGPSGERGPGAIDMRLNGDTQ